MTTIRGSLTSPNNANVILTNIPCDSTVYVGAIVRMTALGVAINALADTEANANVIGVVESKATSILCNIRVLGITEEIYLGLDVTKQEFLDWIIPGGLTQTIPPSGSGFIMVPIGQPFSSTRLLVFKKDAVKRI